MSDDPDFLDDKSDRELILTAIAKLRSLINTGNKTAQQVNHAVHLLEARPPRTWGIVFNPKTLEIVMSGTNSNTFTLTNLATPANATSFLGGVDETSGASSIPTATVTSNNGSLVTIVGATSLTGPNNEWVFGVYPIDTSPETNDTVNVSVALSDGSTVPFVFVINGQGPAITEDASSGVKPWNGVVPATPQ